MPKISVSQSQMNLILLGVEYGVRSAEKGNNLQAAMAGVFDNFLVEKPAAAAPANSQ